MTLIALLFHPTLHSPGNAVCPFCPGDEEPDWKTYPGEQNNSKTLRRIMKAPGKLTSEQSGCRPKDGAGNRQAEDGVRSTFDTKAQGPIYHHPDHGDYGNQAHHAISGNQIMKGHDIEKFIDKAHGEIEKDTGYSVNNCANGVCLPAYPKKYGKRGATITWSAEDPSKKHEIMELAMRAGKGQAHIGEHDIDFDANMPEVHHTTYPEEAKKKLQALYDVVKDRWVPECPLCNEDSEPKKPLPPPFRINRRLDNVSTALIAHVTAHSIFWKYFLSEYARDYHYKICRHPHH